MNFNFILNYPWWFILLCIATGVLISAILYYKNTSDDFLPWQKKLLTGFRFLVITLLCFLLLAPLLKMQITQTQEPVILVFQDNTQSLATTRDTEWMKEAYPQELAGFVDDLSADFSVNTYAFGEQVEAETTFDFQDKLTDMSEIFHSLDVLYTNRNVGAVIIAGDGIFNRGQNPLFRASNLMFPIYTIALGDTIPQRDLIISNIRHNRITYLNNIFPLEVTVEAHQARGLKSRLRVMHEGNTVHEETISFTSDSYFETFNIELEALETGIKRYSIELSPVEDEISLDNNTRDFFIEVIDSRQKILILSAGPHPDVGALKQSLEDNENYETRVSLAQNFDENIRDYDMIIWHQLPSIRFAANRLITQATQANLPQLFILGAQSNIRTFNRLQTGVQISVRSADFNDSRAKLNNEFALFQVEQETADLLPQFPPLQTPFATFSLTPGTQIFAHQRIGNVDTEYPLIALSQLSERKTGVITGEGIWRWKLNDYARNNNHLAFNDLVSKLVQFLTVVEDRSFFRVTTENFLYESEQAVFDAELYNRSYELVNEPDVEMTITNEEGEDFEYIFGRTGNAYRLNAGTFPVGEYTYRARTTLGNEEFTAEGLFTVSPLNLEGLNTVANHQLMYQMAENSGGKMFFPGQWDELREEINSRSDIKPLLYTQDEYEDLVNLRWIFFLLLILLATEWFIRKYNGSY